MMRQRRRRARRWGGRGLFVLGSVVVLLLMVRLIIPRAPASDATDMAKLPTVSTSIADISQIGAEVAKSVPDTPAPQTVDTTVEPVKPSVTSAGKEKDSGASEAEAATGVAPTATAPDETATAAVDNSYFDGAVFIGDSRTEGLALYANVKEARYLHAIGATVASICKEPTEKTPQGKVCIIDALAQQSFSKVYIMLGINELGWVYPQTFYDQYSVVIDDIRAINPDATIVMQSILPISAAEEAKGGYISNERIATYNGLIEKLAAEKSCVFLNVASALTDSDGCLPEDMNADGIHLSVAGCRAWMDYLRTHPVG